MRFNNLNSTNRASLVAQTVENPPAMPDTWVWSLGWEDPLEEGTTTHSSILAWRIPWTEQPGGPQSMGSQRVRHKEQHSSTSTILFWVNKNPMPLHLLEVCVCMYVCMYVYGHNLYTLSYNWGIKIVYNLVNENF